METLAAGVWHVLDAHFDDAVLVAHTKSKRGILTFLLVAWWRTARALIKERCDLLITGDAVMFILMWPLVALIRRPAVTMVMGLDLTWRRWPYPAVVRAILPRAKRVFAISSATADIARAIGVKPEDLAVVRLAVAAPAPTSGMTRADVRTLVRAQFDLPDHAIVVLTLGRLVPRKGVRWFVAEVMATLPENVHYVIAGSGPERDAILRAAHAAGVSARVHVSGVVSEADRELLLRGADLFVQPNVETVGDMEGFGLVVLEAAVRGTVVVASDIEGLRDAVVDHETGLLCPSGDVQAWSSMVTALVKDIDQLEQRGVEYQRRALEIYGFDEMTRVLIRELQQLA
jgi:glycosyltransferase involved in cell wall biosynthesis